MKQVEETKSKKNVFCLFYEKTIGRIIPKYGLLSVIFCFVFNSLIYFGLQLLLKDVRRFDLTTAMDESIPFMPAWSVIYLSCFAFWGANYILITRQGKEEWFKFATGDYLSRIICAVFFILMPTTNVRPEVIGGGIGQSLVRFIYFMDAPTNLFPSIHCLVSWFCYIAIRKKEYLPKWYRAFSCIFAIMVFASTLLTKQHFIVDVAGGVLLAEACYFIGNHSDWYKKVMGIFDRINSRIFGEGWNEE